ncbi:MAG: Gfo/Idh/MocA family oxidoreductase [SAR202 cluster bacterium]|nr:Gfo/Idh/MocA family oxidoreductase [SAR202 cluster bacterium]
MATKSSPKYRVALIGAGHMGIQHARAYAMHPRCEVVAIADTDPENLAVATRWFKCAGYSSYDELFKKDKIDIALPILPVRANAGAVVAAAKAGVKAVFCEKPFAGTLEDADRMVAECKSRGIPLAGGIVPRNYPEYWKAKQLIEAGEIGEVQSITIPEPNGQGGCHGLAMARHFALDSDVEWVTGWASGDPMSDHEDTWNGKPGFGGLGGYIRFKNGLEAFSLGKHSPRHAGVTGAIEVIGSKGVFYNDIKGLHLQKLEGGVLKEVPDLFTDFRQKDNNNFDQDGWRVPSPGTQHSVNTLIDHLDTGSPLNLSTGESLRNAYELAIALRESARRGNAPVRLSLQDRSLKMYPEFGRWNYKKEVYGHDKYMEGIAAMKKGG